MSNATAVKEKIDNKVNRKAFRAVADIIEYTGRFNMKYIAVQDRGDNGWLPPVDEKVLWEDCGTVGCVWGWTCAWADVSLDDDLLRGDRAAASELGITDDQSARLFYAKHSSVWAELAEEYGWALTSWGEVEDWSAITASQAAEVLRRIASNKVAL